MTVCAAFSNKNISATLQLFEGMGADLSPNKFQPIAHMFEDTFFVIASNDFPRVGQLISDVHWRAIETRVNFVHLERTHDGTEEFPYGPGHLAMALNHLSNQRAHILDQQAKINLKIQEEVKQEEELEEEVKQEEKPEEVILQEQVKPMPVEISASQPSGWNGPVLMQQSKKQRPLDQLNTEYLEPDRKRANLQSQTITE